MESYFTHEEIKIIKNLIPEKNLKSTQTIDLLSALEFPSICCNEPIISNLYVSIKRKLEALTPEIWNNEKYKIYTIPLFIDEDSEPLDNLIEVM